MTATSSNPWAAGRSPGGGGTSGSSLPGSPADALVPLDHALARDSALVGGKAAALARVRTAGLPTAPGVIVTTQADVDRLTADADRFAALVRHHLGDGPLIARSSSPVEDATDQSMAGRFDTIADLRDADQLVAGVRAVVASGKRVATEDGLDEAPPVAVLIQPLLDSRFGGVAFAAEPVTGRVDRKFAVTSSAGPDAIVSGRVAGVRHLLDRNGRLLHREGDDDWEAILDRRRRRELSWLIDRLGQLFGGPQDVEFLEDLNSRFVVLQSRPVTTELRGTPVGPIYGTGPVAETFPERLSRLEQDLWVPPLRDGLREALRVTSMASRTDLRSRPLVVVHDGRVAVDLEMLGALSRRRTWRSRLDLRPFARRARATWRVGQLRASLPKIARDLIGTTDDALARAGSLGELSDRQLVGVMHRGRAALRSLHGHEVLIGLLSGKTSSSSTGLSVALRALVSARQEGLTDDEIIARSPVVLALTGPRIDGVSLPVGTPALPPPLPAEATGDEAAILREALRVRVRWVQELHGARDQGLGHRLVERDVLSDEFAIMDLGLDEVAALGTGTAVARTAQLVESCTGRRTSLRLPSLFRFDAEQRVVAVAEPGHGHGVGAGGGVGSGPVTFDADDPAPASVLVVDELRPSLAPVIGRLAGLVAETGSPLAHVAILAREASIPTVVGVSGAMRSLEEGRLVDVDGDAGTVRALGATRCRSTWQGGADMRKLSLAALTFTLVLTAIWAALSLYRWEWTRALWMTMLFVVAEVALVGVLIMQRLRDLEEQIEDTKETAVMRRRVDALPATDRFEWLKEATNRTNVFVTVLLGGGVLVSGVLWVIDKLAGRSVASSRERRLAGQLRSIAFPASGFVPPDSVLFAADLDRDEREDLALLLLGRTETPR